MRRDDALLRVPLASTCRCYSALTREAEFRRVESDVAPTRKTLTFLKK